MKTIKTATKVKIGIVIIIWITYFIIKNIYYPIITNQVALTQFDNTSESFTNIQMLKNTWDFAIVPMLVTFSLSLFIKEFKNLLHKKEI